LPRTTRRPRSLLGHKEAKVVAEGYANTYVEEE
jgi:hypothetical protein